MFEKPSDYNREITLTNTRNGYWYFYDPEHPLSHKDGTVYYHRHIASIKLERWILSDEHVHHRDENRENNNQENIDILSCSKHISLHARKQGGGRVSVNCNYCGKEISVRKSRVGKYSRIHCSDPCRREADRKMWLTKEELADLVWEMPTSTLAKILGISDTALAKWCNKWEIEKPGRGYWAGRDY